MTKQELIEKLNLKEKYVIDQETKQDKCVGYDRIVKNGNIHGYISMSEEENDNWCYISISRWEIDGTDNHLFHYVTYNLDEFNSFIDNIAAKYLN